MDVASSAGRQFEFENAYWRKPKKCRFVHLYQVGEIGCESDFRIVEHLQVCHEITYIISGDGYVYTDSRVSRASPGDVFLTRKGQMHAIQADKQSVMRYFYLAFDFNPEADAEPYSLVRDLFLLREDLMEKDSLEIDRPFSRLVSELYYMADFSDEMINSYIEQILLLVCRLFQHTATSKYLPIKSIKPAGYTVYAVLRYINENIYRVESINAMAKDLGYCSSYLSRIFKKRMGMTLQSYLIIKKMEKAVEMIEQEDFTITEIALRLHFESLQSFSKSFKRTLGLSPQEYRNEYQRRAACGGGRQTKTTKR
ncbi:MAG TPA: AraC family transcriptional regulator [Firmicutes bacterium]|nr:AraC family transcriptional regulator [Bacillota bacterium]